MTQVADRERVLIGTLTIPNGSTASNALDVSSMTVCAFSCAGDSKAESTLQANISTTTTASWAAIEDLDGTARTLKDTTGTAAFVEVAPSVSAGWGEIRITQAGDPGADVTWLVWGRGVG